MYGINVRGLVVFFLWVDEYKPVSSQKQTSQCCACYEQNIQHKSICFFLQPVVQTILSFLIPKICICVVCRGCSRSVISPNLLKNSST